MSIQELRSHFLEYMNYYGHIPLKELSLITPSETTFFTMAAVKAVEEYYHSKIPPNQPNLMIIQRMFSANQLEFAGRFPVATPMEVQMSIFRFRDNTPLKTLELTLNFLKSIGIDWSDLYFITPNRYGVNQALNELTFPQQNVIEWNNPMKYKLGDQGPSGQYGRFCLHYRHGLFPVADLTFVNVSSENPLFIESCFYLERLYFVWEKASTWFDTPLYQDLISTIKGKESNLKGPVYPTAIFMRTLTALLGDGLKVSSKGPGYVARKMIRYLINQWWITTKSFPHLVDFVKPSLSSLEFLGYNYFDFEDYISNVLRNELELSINNIENTIEYIDKQVKKTNLNNVDLSLILKWKDSRGIYEEISLKVLEDLGIDTAQIRLFQKNENILI